MLNLVENKADAACDSKQLDFLKAVETVMDGMIGVQFAGISLH